MRSMRIVEVGPVAARILGAAGEGRVVAAFERTAYVEIAGELLCIASAEVGSGALNARIAPSDDARAWLATLAPGMRVACRPPRVDAAAASLDGALARLWRPPPIALPVDGVRLARGIARTRAAFAARVPRDGIGFLVLGSRGSSDPLGRAAEAAADALIAWLAPMPSEEPAQALAALIGLGPGATPSGDDFIGGALIALHALGASGRARALASRLQSSWRRGTHPVSAAHLDAAAEGCGGEALHGALAALAGDRAPEPALAALAAIGHTSGLDALAGAMTVAAAMVAQRDWSTRTASSAACAFDGATIAPAASSVRTWRE